MDQEWTYNGLMRRNGSVLCKKERAHQTTTVFGSVTVKTLDLAALRCPTEYCFGSTWGT